MNVFDLGWAWIEDDFSGKIPLNLEFLLVLVPSCFCMFDGTLKQYPNVSFEGKTNNIYTINAVLKWENRVPQNRQ